MLDTYITANNFLNAKEYYNKAIITLLKSKPQSQIDSINLASVFNNAGEAFLRIKKYDSALLYFNDAKIIFDKVKYQRGTGYSLGNIGIVYANTGKNNLAEKKHRGSHPHTGGETGLLSYLCLSHFNG